MPIDQEATELLLEVALPQDVAQGIPGGSEYGVPTARLISVKFRVRVLSGPIPPSITLQNLRLWSGGYNNTYPEKHVVALGAGGPVEVERVGGAVFPFAGLVWLEAQANAPGFNLYNTIIINWLVDIDGGKAAAPPGPVPRAGHLGSRQLPYVFVVQACTLGLSTKNCLLSSMNCFDCSGVSSSVKIAFTGHTGSHAPQSIHSSGCMKS